MKRITLIISHDDIVNVISEIMLQECIEPFKPSVTLEPAELTDLVKLESFSLDSYDSNMKSIMLLSTQYTYTLCGWLPAQFEPRLVEALTPLSCAWLIEDPHPGDYENIPVLVKHPQLFGKMRSGGRSVFQPLARLYSM